ncbi:uncharacterized protein LOC118183051 isoform X1 [Stegodyphus dumicola]|uniref:uncharacterized protein LOC118183051 isoform X1 n=2 Tax=Stegodyphus dumicola TaxID=202533 RepID=UPI0015A9544F|nr:uncharacterized protein LOC118183051 isoform X1 [Stegodyphus dumicola]
MCLSFLVTFLSAVPLLMAQGRMISCSCTTTHCREEGTRTCNTTGLCFSQYLDRRDGSDPLVRGCIASRTPLLCENRRPAVPDHKGWPVLHCCDKPMCNARISPTVPTSTIPSSLTGISTTTDVTEAPPIAKSSPKYMDSVYVAILGIGVCCLGVATAIAVLLSRRHSGPYDPEFGPVNSNGYVKGCPEVPAVPARGQDNKVAMDT